MNCANAVKKEIIRTLFGGLFLSAAVFAEGMDNSDLLPPVRPDDEVALEGFSPDWVKTLIMLEFRIETATEEGTFESAVKVLDHCAEAGINGIWINPVYERPADAYGNNGYANFGPHTLDARLTGTDRIEKGYREIRDFTEAAHERNIRVIFDLVAWGAQYDAPLVEERPGFFIRLDNGELREAWGGYLFDWKNPEFREWYFNQAERFIEETGADGFRVDLAPDISGYHFRELRERLLKKGHKIMLMAEMPAERRETFDLDQLGVNGWTEPPKYSDKEAFAAQKERFGSMHDSTFFFRTNMVDAIRAGTGIGRPQLQQQGKGGLFRFYTVSPLFHDGHRPFVQGNRVRFGYLLLAPFIPVWWIGEEWNNPRDFGDLKGAMFFNRIDWSAKNEPANRAFFEDVKRMIRVRRRFPDIFEWFPPASRDANIAKVNTLTGGESNPLQAFMRYRDDCAVLVVPNIGTEPAELSIRIPWDEWGAERHGVFKITDLMNEQELLSAEAQDVDSFAVQLPAEHLGVYLIEKEKK